MKMFQINKKIKNSALMSGALLTCIFTLTNCSNANKLSSAEYPANNSGQNKQDVGQPTPENQQENDVDLKITQKIRQAIVDDDSLSMDGKNSKIITANGFVTLRGPVDTEQEKQNIGAKAARVAGVAHVDNQLEVKNK